VGRLEEAISDYTHAMENELWLIAIPWPITKR
jgi:hypothetical protein